LAALLLAGGTLAAAPGPPPGLPGKGEADPRLRVEASQPPWRAVARLQVPGIARCTAVMVSPRVAVTAAHCLWSRRLGGWVPAGAVHLLTGYAAGAFSAHLLAEGYRIAPGYDPAKPDATRGADLALVSLATPAADVLALAPESPRPGTAAVLGGYNQDHAEVIEADTHCAVTALARDGDGRTLLLHDCSATRGTSGGPLLIRDQDGHLVLAGVQVAGRATRAGGAAVPVDLVRRLLAGVTRSSP
jgi:protease YdgD